MRWLKKRLKATSRVILPSAYARDYARDFARKNFSSQRGTDTPNSISVSFFRTTFKRSALLSSSSFLSFFASYLCSWDRFIASLSSSSLSFSPVFFFQPVLTRTRNTMYLNSRFISSTYEVDRVFGGAEECVYKQCVYKRLRINLILLFFFFFFKKSYFRDVITTITRCIG